MSLFNLTSEHLYSKLSTSNAYHPFVVKVFNQTVLLALDYAWYLIRNSGILFNSFVLDIEIQNMKIQNKYSISTSV